jgi:hypothetical protein
MLRHVTLLRVALVGLACLGLAACAQSSGLDDFQRAIESHLPFGAPAGTPADPQTAAAIQLVITRTNVQQEQAIASRNPATMRDTSTDRYYQETVQGNRDLLASGVTSIKLDKLEWGPITVDGDNASATAYETWSTTLANGTTDQATERNVYALLLQNGAWKIDGDEHPDGPAASSSGAGGGQRPNATLTPSRGSPVPVSPDATPPPAGSAEAAIRDVIERGNHEQEQAIASRDSSVMQDTSTTTYYRQLAQENQAMLDSGVTGIRLVSTEWGQITVNGNTARATTFETWETKSADGTVQQNRDRNEYRLMQQNGAWKIQADDHPDSGPSIPFPLPRGGPTV